MFGLLVLRRGGGPWGSLLRTMVLLLELELAVVSWPRLAGLWFVTFLKKKLTGDLCLSP